MILDASSFIEHLAGSGLLRPGMRVVVAASGGRDSTALLHLLHGMRREWHLDLHALHLDHRMRPGSATDMRWLAGVCRAWSVPLIAASALVPPASEAEARALRYALLRSAGRMLRADAVVTAHHRDDQAETVLMRIARGTGVSGLRGIVAKRGRLVRPLLPFDRASITAYCAAAGLAWREDPSNADPRWMRNRVRAALMPALGMEAALAAAGLAADADAVEAGWRVTTDELERLAVTPSEYGFSIAVDRLAGYDPAARARLIRRLMARLGAVPTRSATAAALSLIAGGAAGSGVDLGRGVRLERGLAELRLERVADAAVAVEGDVAALIAGSEGNARARVGGRTFRVDWKPALREDSGADAGSALIAESALPLALRAWQPGDRIRLAAGSRKLKKLFNDWRVERPQRGRMPLLADASGRVLWIAGRVAAVDAATAGEPLLRISVRDAELE